MKRAMKIGITLFLGIFGMTWLAFAWEDPHSEKVLAEHPEETSRPPRQGRTTEGGNGRPPENSGYWIQSDRASSGQS